MMTLERNVPVASPESDFEIDAYNAAFDELGLDCRWDRSVARELAAIPVENARIAAFLRSRFPHLLKAYPAEFLAEAIAGTKARICAQR